MRLRFCIVYALFFTASGAECIEMTPESMVGCLSAVVGCVGETPVILRPQWPGHPVCLNRLGWLGYAYNMRAYSCGLSTGFSLTLSSSACGRQVACMHIRELHKDEAYYPASNSVLSYDEKYSVAFHRMLLYMFSLQRVGAQTYDRLTIESERTGCLTRFLRESCRTKKEAHYVLAALVLLGEGVDVPIETSGNRVIIKKRKDSNDVLVDACVVRAALCYGEARPSEVWQVINFFKQYRRAKRLPDTHKKF
ncbi:uncharacterized protein NEMAJ01_2022 [Nematocida major]|uniref:uncharacterized protein n=1 Tax=Nematocida major TaxID=1912982 RepID=UPI0020081A72|nr:uncharacterized protein NEMAJ01_2022 [Nematocida major]KAH9387126.1 hypothetical protein NEMAJ01_2022 [Nematocida major]